MSDRARFELGVRLDWPDVAKGIGIFLVVAGHVWRGLDEAGIPIEPRVFQVVDTLIYNFHMPLFFFVAGLFFSHQLARAGLTTFLRSRVTGLLWPLAVWTWIFFAAKAMIGGLANSPVSWHAFPIVPLPPREEFWFLWALFLVQAVCAVTWRWARSLKVELALMGGAIILYDLRFGVDHFAVWLVGAYDFAPFLLLGSLYARLAPVPGRKEQPLVWLGLFVLAEALAVLLPNYNALLRLLLEGMAVIGFVRVLDGCGTQWRGRSASVAAFLGRASLTIYVGHVFFAASVRILLLKAGIHNLALHCVAGVLAGVLAPLAMAIVLRQLGLARALGLRFP